MKHVLSEKEKQILFLSACHAVNSQHLDFDDTRVLLDLLKRLIVAGEVCISVDKEKELATRPLAEST